MKFFLPLLILCLLCGCATLPPMLTASSAEDPPPEAIAPLADMCVGFENFDLDKVVLTELPTKLKPSAFQFESGLNLVASIPEDEIALYAPLSDEEFRGVLVRRGDQLYKFDWEFAPSLLHAAWADYDNDGENELAVGVRTMQGPQIRHEELHVVKLGSDGTAQDYRMPEKLYQDDLTHQLLCEMDPKENCVTIRMGTDATVSFTPTQSVPETPQDGDGINPIYELVFYSFEADSIIGTYGIPINCHEWVGGLREDRASVVANVGLQDGEFELWNHNLKISVK